MPDVSALWRDPPPDLLENALSALEAGIAECPQRPQLPIFFRADDIGVPGDNAARLFSVFRAARAKLCAALVPAWTTTKRWEAVKALSGPEPLWCWHQHGLRHVNHEPTGKKAEFGVSRPVGEARRDLLRGRARLEEILGRNFYPFFTPPWNRCGPDALSALKEEGFAGVSASVGSLKNVPAGLPEFSVCADLHTGKEDGPNEAADRLCGQLRRGAASGLIGVMIHHQRMNAAAFDWLLSFLQKAGRQKGLVTVNFAELVEMSR